MPGAALHNECRRAAAHVQMYTRAACILQATASCLFESLHQEACLPMQAPPAHSLRGRLWR